MMANLFSIFDPSMSIFKLSWVSFLLIITFVFVSLHQFGVLVSLSSVLTTYLMSEINQLARGSEVVFSFLASLFILILSLNFSSLFPFVFPVSSQISIVFPLALIFWVSCLLFSWCKNFSCSAKSLLPQGTPYILMPFMILIEMISVIIRPVTLSIRLTANITAGHLLLSILVSFSLIFGFNLLFFLLIFLMDALETAVSLIQSYVFFTLVSMYVSEL